MFPSTIFLIIVCSIVLPECKGGEIRGYAPSSHCTPTHDCPKYNVIHSEKEFEIRNYNQALWVTAPSILQDNIMDGLARTSDDLYAYYNGHNGQGVKILTSAGPVVMLDVYNSTYKASYYVPNKYQNGGLPKPVTPKITQAKLPVHKYAAARRVNGGGTLDANVVAQFDKLRESLKGSPYERAASIDRFTYALYDLSFFGQEYELLIWFD